VLLAEGIEQPRDCAAIAQKILDRLSTPLLIMGKTIQTGVSIGIVTCFDASQCDRESMLHLADQAMYRAKLSPHSDYRFYTPEIHQDTNARLKLEEELRHGLAHGEFTLYYQPMIDLRTGMTTGAEALLRWNHPVRGLLLPGEFLAVAEECGCIREMHDWVMHTVCEDCARWKKMGLPPIQVSVNWSDSQLNDEGAALRLEMLLSHFDIDPRTIEIEVPASVMLMQADRRINQLTYLRKRGIRIHLDHFGASAISLSSLGLLPIDALKIDPALTHAMNEPGHSLQLVQAIMDIASRFKVAVGAVGIEHEWQRAFFKDSGCSHAQGNALCRPFPREYVPDWISSSKSIINSITAGDK
jgi:EAL domain-containing protein (putative c-di-GMP-specific phosphodiesterase class I)